MENTASYTSKNNSLEKNINEASPVRALHVFSALVRGGAESRTMELYRKVDKNRVQFDFLELKEGIHDFTEEAISLGANIYHVPHPRKTGFRKYIKSLVQLFKENNIQIVHCHISVASGLVMFAAKKAGVPKRIVHSRSASKVEISKHKIGNYVGRIYDVIMRRLILSCSTDLVTCGTEAGEFLYGKKAMKNRDVVFMPNAIDFSRFNNLISKNDARAKLGISNDTQVIGTVGNLRPVKNHKFLIEVFDEYRRKHNNSKLVIVGDGDQMDNLRNMVQERKLDDCVLLLGRRSDIELILPAFDVFVMPSIYEGVPGAAIEAMACGLPCVLSDSITKDIDFSPNFIKYVSLNNSVAEWCDTIYKFATTEFDIEEMRSHILKHGYTVDQSLEILYSLYSV